MSDKPSFFSRHLPLILILLAVAVAAAYRLPRLGDRVMHTDEAVHTEKANHLFYLGLYQYDPVDYHGPTIYYLARPIIWLSGAAGFAQTTEVHFRLATALIGIALVLAVLLIAGDLGWWEAALAAALTALSHSMVYLSRYYIQEMVFIFFAFIAIAAGWRCYRSRRLGWALLSGACLGLMHATKETDVITCGAVGLGVILTVLWTRWRGSDSELLDENGAPQPVDAFWREVLDWHRSIVAVAAGVGAAIVVAFFVMSLADSRGVWQGPLDSVTTYLKYLSKASGEVSNTQDWHVHPWHYYLQRLIYFKIRAGAWWSEAFIVVLAVVGGCYALSRNGLPERQRTLARFLTFYTISLTVVYSTIPYKTPWCLLSFLHGMILLAGVGGVALVRELLRMPLRVALWPVLAGAAGLLALGVFEVESAFPLKNLWRYLSLVHGALLLAAAASVLLIRRWPKLPVLVVALALLGQGAGHLGVQAYRGSFTFYRADPRNPYVYAHTSQTFLNLVRQLEEIAAVSPAGHNTLIKVIAPGGDYWPLPWYLRRFTYVVWAPNVEKCIQDTGSVDAEVIIATPQVRQEIARELGGLDGFVMSMHGLRPNVLLESYVTQELWDDFVARRSESSAKSAAGK